MQELISKDKDGNLTVTSLVIAEVFKIPHKSVLRNINRLCGRHNLVPREYIDSRGRSQRMFSLTERQFLIVMPFIRRVVLQ